MSLRDSLPPFVSLQAASFIATAFTMNLDAFVLLRRRDSSLFPTPPAAPVPSRVWFATPDIGDEFQIAGFRCLSSDEKVPYPSRTPSLDAMNVDGCAEEGVAGVASGTSVSNGALLKQPPRFDFAKLADCPEDLLKLYSWSIECGVNDLARDAPSARDSANQIVDAPPPVSETPVVQPYVEGSTLLLCHSADLLRLYTLLVKKRIGEPEERPRRSAGAVLSVVGVEVRDGGVVHGGVEDTCVSETLALPNVSSYGDGDRIDRAMASLDGSLRTSPWKLPRSVTKDDLDWHRPVSISSPPYSSPHAPDPFAFVDSESERGTEAGSAKKKRLTMTPLCSVRQDENLANMPAVELSRGKAI